MRVLGIDPGTAIVGYGIVEEVLGKYQLVDCGCIYTDKTHKMEDRITEIFTELSLLIDLYKPDYVAIEELFFFKNNKTIISVAQARGVMVLAATIKKIPIAEYTPLQVKMGITSYGRATKSQVQEMVKILLGHKEIIKPDDAADAVAIAITHINGKKFLPYGVNSTAVAPKKLGKVSQKSNKMSLAEYKALLK